MSDENPLILLGDLTKPADNAGSHEVRFLKRDQSTTPERIRKAFKMHPQAIQQSGIEVSVLDVRKRLRTPN